MRILKHTLNSTAVRLHQTYEGFTLIEILVAATILCILAVIVSNIVGNTSVITTAGHKRLGADEEARIAFDRMAADFTGIVKRKDIDPLFLQKTGNDQFYFYSQAPANWTSSLSSSVNNSQIALIGYAVGTNGGLQRYGDAQGWDSLSFATPSASITNNTSNYTVIAPSVFRIEYALLMRPGSINNTNGLGPVTDPALGFTTNGLGVYFQTNNAGQALHDVAGIVVALAILDPTSRKIVSSAAIPTMGNNTASFPDTIVTSVVTSIINGASGDGIPVGTWRTNTYSLLGVPVGARSQIRIYQRYFPLSQ